MFLGFLTILTIAAMALTLSARARFRGDPKPRAPGRFESTPFLST